MNIEERLVEICKSDDVTTYAQLIKEGIITPASRICALAYVYSPQKILSYMFDPDLYWGANQNDPIMKTHQLFHVACGAGDIRTLQELIDQGFDNHHYNDDYINISVDFDQLGVARLLLHHQPIN